jgi:hypothetical protein
LLGAAAVLVAPGFFQGTFVDDQGCPWRPVENPENGDNFTSTSQLYEYLDSRDVASLPDDVELQVRDGVVYQKISDGCGTVGGET